MAEAVPQQEGTKTITLTADSADSSSTQEAVTLTLQKPKRDKKVNWSEGTVDNEHLNRKKSKCCCIYKKPRNSLESSSSEEEDLDCEHCRGHVENKKIKGSHGDHHHDEPTPSSPLTPPPADSSQSPVTLS